MKLYVFPGQGSQYRGMGAELFDKFPDYVQSADEILGYSIKTLCLEDPSRQLSKTEFTQPALYVVNILTYLNKLREGPAYPDYLAGHSLGEYCALFAGGAFSFDAGLKLVKKRGELMSRASGGGMAAVLGYDSSKVKGVLEQNGLHGLDIANYNSPVQTVLSGPMKEILAAEKFFPADEVTYIPLNVSAPFHSRYMADVMNEFEAFLNGFEYSPLKIPVISNVTARPYQDSQIVENLTRQICGSVRWTDSIRYLMEAGDFEFEEMGPGDVLTKLVCAITGKPVPAPKF